jgi:hypothetical protein
VNTALRNHNQNRFTAKDAKAAKQNQLQPQRPQGAQRKRREELIWSNDEFCVEKHDFEALACRDRGATQSRNQKTLPLMTPIKLIKAD